jgi:hypothetical protein
MFAEWLQRLAGETGFAGHFVPFQKPCAKLSQKVSFCPHICIYWPTRVGNTEGTARGERNFLLNFVCAGVPCWFESCDLSTKSLFMKCLEQITEWLFGSYSERARYYTYPLPTTWQIFGETMVRDSTHFSCIIPGLTSSRKTAFSHNVIVTDSAMILISLVFRSLYLFAYENQTPLRKIRGENLFHQTDLSHIFNDYSAPE